MFRKKKTGTTKWSYMSLLKYAISNITSFSSAPMQFVTLIGVLFFGFSVILGIQSLINFINGDSLEGFTTIILLLLGIGSIIMMSLGIIGYYTSKIYEEIKRRQRYIISHTTTNESWTFIKRSLDVNGLEAMEVYFSWYHKYIGWYGHHVWSLYNLAGASYWLSSSANYTLTSILSFFLNKHFTFRNQRQINECRYTICH